MAPYDDQGREYGKDELGEYKAEQRLSPEEQQQQEQWRARERQRLQEVRERQNALGQPVGDPRQARQQQPQQPQQPGRVLTQSAAQDQRQAALVHEQARSPETHEIYSRLEFITRELRSGVSLRHWDVIEGAVFRLEQWKNDISLRTHEQTADADAMRQARVDAQADRRARFEAEEAERVAQEHRDRVAGGAIRNRDRFATPQVDNVVREEAAAEKHVREVPEATQASAPFRPSRQLPADVPKRNDQFSPARPRQEDEF